MDPLSVTAGAIAIVQISGAIITTCYDYRSRAKSATKDASRIISELNGLRTVIESLFLILEDESQDTSPQKSVVIQLAELDGPLLRCQDNLKELQKKLEPKEGWRAARAKLIWPLRESEVRKVLQDIENTKATLQLALAVDQRKATGAIQDSITSLAQQFATSGISSKREKIFRWLQAPEAISIHIAARNKCHSSTGQWFVDGPQFKNWANLPNSFLWIHGIPGCGKTILSSTIIDHISREWQAFEEHALAYFYFDFNDNEKSKPEALVRSIIAQLFVQKAATATILEILFAQNHEGLSQPVLKDLLAVLCGMLVEFKAVYLVVDALDECADIEEILQVLQQIRGWDVGHLHIIVTSRLLADIEVSLVASTSECLSLGQSSISEDISLYISQRLQNDPRLAKWPPEVQNKIQRRLDIGSSGMFRWVACQFETLRRCLTIKQLERELEALPTTLEETYDRILLQIDECHRADALRILQWLAFAARPVTLYEAAEVLAIECGDEPRYNADLKPLDPLDVMFLCSTLVTKAPAAANDETTTPPVYHEYNIVYKNHWVIRLAHLSVKDYLVSARIRSTKASIFATEARLAHVSMAHTCIAYLSQPAFLSGHCDWETLQTRLREWPLYHYAAHFWPYHIKASGGELDDGTWQLLQRFFNTRTTATGGNYSAWIVALTPDVSLNRAQTTPLLYYAAAFGILSLVRKLLKDPAVDVDLEVQGGLYDSTPLLVAVFFNHTDVVRLLLEAGADSLVRNRYGVNGLVWSILNGNTEIQDLLEERGAILTPQDGDTLEWYDKNGSVNDELHRLRIESKTVGVDP